MPQYHFPVRDLEDVALTGAGQTEDGYDYIELTGDIQVSTDNIVYLAMFFASLATRILEAAIDDAGEDAVAEELEQILAGLPFQEPDPEDPQLELPLEPTPDELLEAIRRHPSSAPDIEGRDV